MLIQTTASACRIGQGSVCTSRQSPGRIAVYVLQWLDKALQKFPMRFPQAAESRHGPPPSVQVIEMEGQSVKPRRRKPLSLSQRVLANPALSAFPHATAST